MKNGKKLLSLLLVGSMALSLAACGDDAATTPPSSDTTPTVSDEVPSDDTSSDETPSDDTATLDTSERVDYVFYVMGDAPQDEVVVEEAINEKLLEKFNATIDMQFSTWTDFNTKYNNELVAGTADIIYIANWLDYGTLAKNGAFINLDEYLAGTPDLQALCGTYLDMMKVDGSVYAIPGMWPEFVSAGITYREDLREQYDLPVPNSIENIEAYLLGIKENMPDQGLLLPTTGESTGFQTAFDAFWVTSIQYPWVFQNGLEYGLTANIDSPSAVYDYWMSEEFVADCKLMKKWADLGFWSKSALNDTNDSEAFNNGLCVMTFWGQNPSKANSNQNTFDTAGNGWKAEYYAFGETTGAIFPAHGTQNGTALTKDCEDPARALAIIEYFMCDEAMNKLIQCGIEGTHYTIDENGYYQSITDENGTAAFGYEGFSTWNLRNSVSGYKLGGESDARLQAIFDRLDVIGAKCKYPNTDIKSGFTEVYDDYAAERTALSNVMRQYLAPLQAGLVDDVDAAVEEFRTKANEAGRETIIEAYKTQWAEYCATNGYE